MTARMSEQREALAEVLGAHEQVVGGCSCGWRVARRSVEAWRAHVAAALLASPALARLLADAEQRGADRVAAAVEAVALNLDRGDSIDRGIATDLRAALTTGAGDRVRAEEGER